MTSNSRAMPGLPPHSRGDMERTYEVGIADINVDEVLLIHSRMPLRSSIPDGDPGDPSRMHPQQSR